MVWEQLITSKIRVRILEYLFTHPDERVYLRGLEKLLNQPATPMRRELQKLEQLGLVKSAMEANVKYYLLDTTSPAYTQLRPLIAPQTSVDLVGPVEPVKSVEAIQLVQPVASAPVPLSRRVSWGWIWAVAGLTGVVLAMTLAAVMRTQQQLADLQQQVETTTARRVTMQVVPAPRSNESRSQRWRVMPGNWSGVEPAESVSSHESSY